MKTVGVIAEYNPFHNGHAYQLNKIRKELGADFIIVAMSGNFVQRGEPAIIDKYARTQMALSCGADLVIELPALWATSSAESFAMAGVTLFDKMGCIDTLVFGAETNNLTILSLIADILVEEPDIYRIYLNEELKQGLNYPVARSNALRRYFSSPDFVFSYKKSMLYQECLKNPNETSEIPFAQLESVLSEPNNILAIEYLKAIRKRKSSISPYAILRTGSGYHDETTATSLASATAIRKELFRQELNCKEPQDSLSNCLHSSFESNILAHTMPASCYQYLKEYLADHPALFADDFSDILRYLLLVHDKDDFSIYGDTNEFLSNRIKKNKLSFQAFSSFCELLKTKDFTYTRISRALLHILLDFKDSDYMTAKEFDYIAYLRILGFKKTASPLLSLLKKNASVMMVTKLANAAALLDPLAFSLLEKDIFAASLYENMIASKTHTASRSEYTREIVIF